VPPYFVLKFRACHLHCLCYIESKIGIVRLWIGGAGFFFFGFLLGPAAPARFGGVGTIE